MGYFNFFFEVLKMSYAPKNVKEAWDNHFSAFGAQDLEKILKDYDDNSIIRYVENGGEMKEYKGTSAVSDFFTGLFDIIQMDEEKNIPSLAAPVVDVEEAVDGAPGMVFLVWNCPDSGIMKATDTFVFSEDNKIRFQNVVAKMKTKEEEEKGD